MPSRPTPHLIDLPTFPALVDPGGTRPGLVERCRRFEPGQALATSMIVVSAVLTASAVLSSRRLSDAGLAPAAIAWYRFALVALVLGPTVLRPAVPRPARLRPARPSGSDPTIRDRTGRRSAIRWGLASGVILALGWASYSHALAHAPVGDVAVAYLTFPLFTMASMWLLFRSRPTAGQLVGGATVLLAAVIALGPGGGSLPVTALLAPIGFGLSIAILTERLVVLDAFERLAAVAIGATVGLSPLVVTLEPARVVPGSIAGVGWVIAVGVGAALLPMLLYSVAAPVVGGAVAAVAGTVELPAMFAIGALAFAEPITAPQVVGAALIAAAIVGTSRSGRGPTPLRAGPPSVLPPRRRSLGATRAPRPG